MFGMIKNLKQLTLKSMNMFALRTSQQTIIKNVIHQKKVDRESLKLINEQTKSDEQLKQDLKEQQRLDLEMVLSSMKSNDNNPANYIKVKIRSSNPGLVLMSQPLIVPVVSKPRMILITGTRRNVFQSTKKVYPIFRAVLGKHVYEAIEYIAAVKKKSAKQILSALQMVRHHAITQGYDEERLYLQSAITNKNKRFGRMRFHAKGRGNMGHRDVSQIRITLVEKPAKDIFSDVIRGKTPPILAYQLKTQLLDRKAGFKDVQKLQFMLTSKGRQQQKLMMTRRAQLEMKLQKEAGVNITYKVVEQRLIDGQAQEMVDLYEKKKLTTQQDSLKERQTVFQKNEKSSI